MPKTMPFTSFCLFLSLFLTACSATNDRKESYPVYHKPKKIAVRDNNNKTSGLGDSFAKMSAPPSSQPSNENIQVISKPDTISVLVNKQNRLPDSYTPKDLLYTNIPFIVTGKLERTKMRREAAHAVEKLFAKAKEHGVHLLGVSAYRSHVKQEALFHAYAKRDGYIKARTYSALPGTSEHETGLAIDVTGGNGSCAAMDCFGFTDEAKWLQDHAADFGFIIRYPKGKDSITGYKYEPWHLRYVGNLMAKEIMTQGITLEEYFGIVPVNH